MLNFTKAKEVAKKPFHSLNEGDVFMFNGEKFSFVRVKSGGKSIVATSLEKETDYSIKINIFNETLVYGVVDKEERNDTSISIKDVKLNEAVVIMTGRGNSVPQLYKLVEVNKSKAHSHTFINPVSKRRESFKSTDSWKVFRVKDII